MKFAGLLFNLGALFFAVVATVYGIWSRDWAGTTALAFTGFMTLLIGFYVTYTARRLDNRPEDDRMANQDEADPDYGFFSPHSWWPLPIGLGAMVTALGLVFAVWLLILGVGILMFGVLGLVYEYYIGDYAH